MIILFKVQQEKIMDLLEKQVLLQMVLVTSESTILCTVGSELLVPT